MTDEQHREQESKPLSIHLDFIEMIGVIRDAVWKRAGFVAAFESALVRKIGEKVRAGEITEEEGDSMRRSVMDSIRSHLESASRRIDSGIHRTLASLHLISTRDITEIETRLDRIIATLERRRVSPGPETERRRGRAHAPRDITETSARTNPPGKHTRRKTQ